MYDMRYSIYMQLTCTRKYATGKFDSHNSGTRLTLVVDASVMHDYSTLAKNS